MQAYAALLVTQHINDLLREADIERRNALVRGARRSAWSAFSIRVRHLVRRLGRRGSRNESGRPDSIRPASAQA